MQVVVADGHALRVGKCLLEPRREFVYTHSERL